MGGQVSFESAPGRTLFRAGFPRSLETP